MKKINLLFGLFVLCSLLFIGCGSDKKADGGTSSSPDGTKTEDAVAKGGRNYGGIFKINEEEYLRTLFPLNVGEVVGHRITNQIYESLVRLDQKDLTIQPELAESWTIENDAKLYTFKIRKGVKFHDDPCFPDGKGREVTAKDFKYCLDKLCTYSSDNKGYDFV